jgi:hypothetical protein
MGELNDGGGLNEQMETTGNADGVNTQKSAMLQLLESDEEKEEGSSVPVDTSRAIS